MAADTTIRDAQRARVRDRLNAYLTGTPLAGLGAAFVSAGQRHGVDPFFLASIAKAETDLGRTGNAGAIHNPFGMGPGIRYPSWREAIDAAAANLAGSLYAGAGLTTTEEIAGRWAPGGAANDPHGLNANWVGNVKAAYRALTGSDPGDVVGTDRSGQLPVFPGDPQGGFFPGTGIGEAIEGGAEAIAGAGGAVFDAATAVPRFLARLADPDLWLRVGFAVGGLLATGVGLVTLLKALGQDAIADALPVPKLGG